MAGSGPSILVVDDDCVERTAIASVLCEVGFAVVAAAPDRSARAAMARQCFAAAIVAMPEGDGVEFLRHARRWQPGLKALIVIEPAAVQCVDEADDTLVTRPFDARRLLGCVFELVLREREDIAPHHNHAAEFGIAAARIACLNSRRTAAAAAGASRLGRQIGETRAMPRELDAALAVGGLAVVR